MSVRAASVITNERRLWGDQGDEQRGTAGNAAATAAACVAGESGMGSNRTRTSTAPPGPGASLRARIAGETARARSRPLRPTVLRALGCGVAAGVLAAVLWALLASPNPLSVVLTAAGTLRWWASSSLCTHR